MTIQTKSRLFVITILVSQLLTADILFAQVTGRITGSVVDPSAAVIPGAEVAITMPGGSRATFTTVTTDSGLFTFIGVPAGEYDLTVSAPNYRKRTERIVVRPGQELSLPAIKLEVGAVTETVEVTATTELVKTSNAEISLSITREQIRELPLLARSPQGFISTQAGVGSSGRGATVINGQRTTFSTVTLDGINIQDNFIRTNALDFSPNVLLLDQVAEITIATSNTNATVGGGSSHVIFVTPSGTNRFHGGANWSNRNSALAANTWNNNRNRVAKPFRNQNFIGGHLGGPIIKDKLFFYGNFEALRDIQQGTATRTILTADARRGIFTYLDNQGQVRKVNILEAMGIQMDPKAQAILQQVPGPEKINVIPSGDSTAALLRNTAGYSFNIRNNRTQDHVTARVDYNLSPRNSFSGSFVWNSDDIDRPDLANDYSTAPKVINDDKSTLVSVGWRWNPTGTFTNELRGGFNLAPVIFLSSEKFGDAIIAGTIFSNPVNTFRTQGRNTDTYNLNDNASYVRGRHNLQFGFQHQRVYVENFNEAGITPTYTLGIGTGNRGLTNAQLPGASATDINAANNLLATLGGFITSSSQTFNVTSRTSGFVGGAANRRNVEVFYYSGYVADSWKMRPRLTVNGGVRYEYWAPVRERDGLALTPSLVGGNPITTLRSNATLDFGGDPFFKADKNNFAPNVGLAWDLFGTGKTALRAGYSLNFVNDELAVVMTAYGNANAGLVQAVTATGLSGRLSSGLPPITQPPFRVPRTQQDNYSLNTQSTLALVNPDLRIPYVQQWNFSLQHQWRDILFEARYVGNHGTQLFRGIDFNQVLLPPEFLADFLRAQNNGNLARARTGVFDPNFNANIPGSQPLTIFPQLGSGGLLNNATIRTLIDQGQVGELARTYMIQRLNGPFNFFPNPLAQTTNLLLNYSHSSYNGLQLDVRGRLRRGLTFQANYTFSKTLSDGASGSENALQSRNEAQLDNARPRLERSRTPFDTRHWIKGNFVYELPIGMGHWLNAKRLERVLSGWQISGILSRRTGSPFSITSGRGTFNRSGVSGDNGANTSLSGDDLMKLFKLRRTGNGVFYVPAAIIGPDGRAVAPDGSQPFTGQVFFHPAAGTLGALQRRMFSGPWQFFMDFSLSKRTKITETHELILRMDAGNIFNHPVFSIGDQNISSTTFGQLGVGGRRELQLTLQYRF